MKKILVIEDNLDIRENICETLELYDYETFEAENGEVGIQIAKREIPDIIICDIMMPGIDGYEVLEVLRQDEETAGIPLVFLTAKAEVKDFRKGLRLGADDYITKPFSESELIHTIEIRLKRLDSFKKAFENEESAEQSAKQVSLSELLDLGNRELKEFKKKEFVFHEGNWASYLFFLKSGAVKTFRLHDDGKELITEIYKKGSYFGYYALLKDAPYQDYAVCLEDSEIIMIPKKGFLHITYNNINIAKKFIRILSNDVDDKEQQLLHMAYDNLKQRVIRTLLDLYEKYKDDQFPEASIKLTREEISKYIGTARESFIRIMSDLNKSGLIEIKDGVICIDDPKGLQSLLI
ncbi:MAG: response regulator [Chitinophagales bacterium]|nr:response regulator [Chitinophagales bacterium]